MGLLDWLTDGIGSAMGQGSPTPMGGGPMEPVAPAPPISPVAPTPPMAMNDTPNTTFTPTPDPSTTDIGGGMQGAGPAAPPVPIPAPRPPGADAGPAALPPTAAPTSGTGMPPGPPTSITPAAPIAVPGPNAGLSPASSFIGRSLGLDANREKSLWGSIGAGLTAAGNSAGKGKGQALFSGAGAAIEGGNKAEDTSYDQRLKSLQLAVTAQAAGDKAAYNKNYAEYLKGKLEADADKTTPNAKKGAWNKPDSQKFIDAQNALAKDPEIHASQKMLEKLATTGTPEEIAKATAAHNALIQQKQGIYLSGVGLDPAKVAFNAKNPPGTPPSKNPDGTMNPGNPHVISAPSQEEARKQFDQYVQPGQAYKNPRDGRIYIRKPEGAAGSDQPAPDQPAAAPSPIAPPGPMPGTTAAPAEEED